MQNTLTPPVVGQVTGLQGSVLAGTFACKHRTIANKLRLIQRTKYWCHALAAPKQHIHAKQCGKKKHTICCLQTCLATGGWSGPRTSPTLSPGMSEKLRWETCRSTCPRRSPDGGGERTTSAEFILRRRIVDCIIRAAIGIGFACFPLFLQFSLPRTRRMGMIRGCVLLASLLQALAATQQQQRAPARLCFGLPLLSSWFFSCRHTYEDVLISELRQHGAERCT